MKRGISGDPNQAGTGHAVLSDSLPGALMTMVARRLGPILRTMPILTFKGKTAVESYHRVVPHHLLEIDAKLSLAKKPSLDGNLIIEGDNLIALKSLLPTHAGKIKCVYIDPPYNTGNEGWIYNDNLTQPQFKEWIGQVVGKEGEDACRHDKWCCMMYPRLQLLKELLREDGAIFISIDDNEVHHLRMMMDEVFGETNFVATVCWQKKYAVSNDDDGISAMHDFVVVYSRTPAFSRKLLPRTAKQNKAYKNPDDDPRGPYRAENFTCNKTKDERPKLYYGIKNPGTGKLVWPDPKNVWRFSEAETQSLATDDRIWWGRDGKSGPMWKNFLSEVQQGLVPSTWWTCEDAGHTDSAKKMLVEIIGVAGASMTPKPVELVDRIIRIATEPGDVILDSFAGSGTTGHAVLGLNAESKGELARQFVLIQQPFDSRKADPGEANLCESVTAERIRRVCRGYKRAVAEGGKQEGLGGEFTYARVGPRMFDEYRSLGDKLPSFEHMARYIWFTETSQTFDAKKIDEKTGFIGAWQNTSYYLLYSDGKKDARPLDSEFLKSLKDKNKRKVVYCEKLWMHRDALREYGDIRAMIVPFNLK